MARRILVVDDSASIRREVSAALAEFEIVEATNGIEGAEALENLSNLGLVICDINMPQMNGTEMLTRTQEKIATDSLAVIMLTPEGQSGLSRQARKLGARGWVVKPFKPSQLQAAARKLIT